ncbi:hypothetical protein Ahy_A03g011230 isoform A [Arachis hypogaea]|uniref:Uncharacterized protein n=1 Tax=Arachis hypogaea TaxID=3818 RepID=A0A445DQ33_ARAHY|nr:hypothetical protein Ahy_A03g011230 isoform A [Arachis hypogaea]
MGVDRVGYLNPKRLLSASKPPQLGYLLMKAKEYACEPGFNEGFLVALAHFGAMQIANMLLRTTGTHPQKKYVS